MADLLSNFPDALVTPFLIGLCRISGVNPFAPTEIGEIEHDQSHCGVVEVDCIEIRPEQVLLIPGNGAGKFADDRSDESDCDFGARLGNSGSDLQFFDPVFHVRSFVPERGFGSRRNPAPGTKGRPVVGAAA